MANPFTGIISSAFKELHKNAIDALLEDDALTVPCRFDYGVSKVTECPNCLFNPAKKRSANIYKAGGPYPFADGQICSYCAGVGSTSTISSETLYLAVIFDYKKWINVGVVIDNLAGMIQTLSSIDILPQIKRAKSILVNTNIENYVKHNYERHSEPIPVGLGQHSHFVTFWKHT